MDGDHFGEALSPAFNEVVAFGFDRDDVEGIEDGLPEGRSGGDDVVGDAAEAIVVVEGSVAPEGEAIAVGAIDFFEDGEDEGFADAVFGFFKGEFAQGEFEVFAKAGAGCEGLGLDEVGVGLLDLVVLQDLGDVFVGVEGHSWAIML